MYKKIWYPIISILLAVTAKGQTFTFAQLKGPQVNTAGWNLVGAAKVANVTSTDNSEILLTPNANAQSGAIFYDQPINFSTCKKWAAEFDYRLYDGTGADGLAFCFLDAPPIGFQNASGLGIPKDANGLKICIDTWNNCNGDSKYQMPKVEIRWGKGYGIYDNSGNLTTEGECRTDNNMPTTTNASGLLSYLRSAAYNHVVVTYNDGQITVTINGKPMFNSVFQQFNFPGYIGFTASTGGSNDNQSIKNVVIYTEMPPSEAGTNPNPICSGGQAQLGAASTTGYSYNWTPAGGLSSTTVSNPMATVLNTTSNVLLQKYFVQTSFTNNPGCYSVDSVTVTVNPGPATDFDVPVVCLPDSNVIIKNKTTVTDGSQTQPNYKWTFSDGTTSTVVNPPHTYSTPGSYYIVLRATSNSGAACQDSVRKDFTVNPKAKAAITIPAEFCRDTAAVFNGSVGGSPVQKWNWSFGDTGIDSVQNPSHKYTSAKTFTVSMYAVTTEGCRSDTVSKQITINPLPTASFTYSGLLCNGDIITFKDGSQPGIGSITGENWSFDGVPGTAGATVTKSFNPYGTHTVSIISQNSKGCYSKPYVQNLVIGPAPVVDFPTPVVCKNNNGIFTDASTIEDGTQSQFTYLWKFDDGATSPGSPASHSFTTAGSHSTVLVVTSGNGCKDSASKTFTVSDYPVVDYNILTTNFCSNLPLQIKDNSSVQYGTINKLNIFWDASQPDYTQVDNPAAGTTYTHNYPSFGYANQLQVTLKVQAYSSGGCYTEKSGVSVLFASPKLVFDPIPTYCQTNTQSMALTQARDTTVLQGTGFYTGDGVNNGNFNPSSAGPGAHTITYHYTLNNGCSDTITRVVEVGIKPAVTAGPSGVVLLGGQIVLQASATGGTDFTYLWTPNTSLSDNTILQPTASPAKDTYYTLLATNGDGCADTSGVLIKVLQYPIIPNAFSPNGDGINDRWMISYISSYPDCKVEVFNRYGQVIFTSTGYAIPWDGTINGKPLPVATYYYIITTSHIPKPMSGSVTILR